MERSRLTLETLSAYRAAEYHLFRVADREILFNVETLLSYEAEEVTVRLLQALAWGASPGVQAIVSQFGEKSAE